MSKKKTNRIKNEEVSHEERVYRVLTNLRHKDLQRECILRGIEPQFVVEWDHPKLVGWFTKNFDNTQDETKLAEFDAWRDNELQRKGYLKNGELVAPALRFSYNGNIAEMTKPHDIKPPNSKVVPKNPKKPKLEVNSETGVRKGTKKALTFDLAIQGLSIDKVIEEVKKTFPEAEPKSIRIWAKKALKQQSSKQTA